MSTLPRTAALPGLLCCWLLALPFGAAAQRSAPLRKSDLVRLLANPLIQRSEVAQVVRRNCLAFQPTARDWSDLRTLGADGDVMGSVGECAARGTVRAAPTATPTAAEAGPGARSPLVAAFLTPRATAAAGARVQVHVQLRRGDGTPARSAGLALRTTPRVAGGPPGEAKGLTDDSGFVAFDLAVGRLPGRYRLELLGGGGAPLPGKPVIDLVVTSGPPAVAEVQPPRLQLGVPGDPPAGVFVTVRDSLGNGVPREPIELRPAGAAMGLPPDTQATDSLGRVHFVVRRAAIRAPGQLEVRARGTTLAALDAVPAPQPPRPEPPPPPPPPALRAEFIQGPMRRGLARTQLADALTLELRGRTGRPLAGKPVVFQAVNAQVVPDSAVTDSSGQIQLQVTLGQKAGIAVITAIVDSVRRQDTVQVEPGAAVELVVEREGQRVDRGRILVELGVPFGLTLRARDRYGNATSTVSLTGRLQELRNSFNSRHDRRLELLAVQPLDLATILTFKPVRLGGTDLLIDVGLTTTVSVEVVAPSR